ncbi:hypothetical protein CSOJ01_15435 [Colletotrichum sojae]|uniref:Uncharacterized protein n=1 Tax=Colletotrichum sojae TaxID=2175907 RepID=A0A8H6IMI6_9PEZI|nr:hypothetical protein CSOJ01_15435 [Colletotrichum sojae]
MSQQYGPLSHLQLIPADKIFAFYNNETNTLKLSAQGEAVHITRDIHFKRIKTIGGLRFQLLGWVGPVTLGDSPYTADSYFNIELPSRVFPTGLVGIETANNKQWVVEIESLLKNGSQKPLSASLATGDADDSVELVPPQEPIIAELGKPFTIQQRDEFKGKGGTVNISFDKNFVALSDAGVVNSKQIEWTFDPIQTGNTEITVFVSQHEPPFSFRVPYEVTIKPPHNTGALNTLAELSVAGLVPANDSSSANKKNGGGNVPGEVLHWDGFVNAGINAIKKQHPDAELYNVSARSFTGQPVDNEWGLGKLNIMTRVGDRKFGVVKSTGWGEFGQVETVPALLGNDIVPWPVSLEIHEAFAILRKGGFQQLVQDLSLLKPLNPAFNQPFYVFHIGSQFIAVGVDDRKVHNFGVTGQEVQQS